MNRIHTTIFCGGLLVLCGCSRQQAQQHAASGPPAVPVSVAKAASESVPTELRVVGAAAASSIVQVKSLVGGQLLRVRFTEGEDVKAGDLLFQIDPQPFQDALRQTEAAVGRDRALVTQAESALARDRAQEKYAELDATRQEKLAQDKIAARMQADQAESTLEVSRAVVRTSEAAVQAARAALESDEAAVQKARLDLSHCEIRAPIAGRTGNLLVHAGNLVKENDVPLVVISQVSPIFVYYSVPEEHLRAIRRLSATRKLEVHVSLRDNPESVASGRLSVVDNAVDAATGTIRLKATFANGDGMLWPGQFVNVVQTLDTIHNATVVPAEAVQAGQQGPYVFAVKPDQTVEVRMVTPGNAFGQKVVIEKGIAPGDTIVTDGQLRLFPGAAIRIVDAGKLGRPL